MTIEYSYDQEYPDYYEEEDPYASWKETFPNHRFVRFYSKPPCAIPKRLDNIYCQLEKEDRQYNNFAKKCHKENIVLELKPPIKTKEDTSYSSITLCFQEYHFSVMGKNTSKTCEIPTDYISLNQCYCDTEVHYIDNHYVKQCFCELKIYENTYIPSMGQTKFYYVRQNCILDSAYAYHDSKLLYCTFRDQYFYFENSYFHISNTQGYRNIDALCSHTSARNCAVPKNTLLPALFLVFYLFRYLELVGKKFLKNKKNKIINF